MESLYITRLDGVVLTADGAAVYIPDLCVGVGVDGACSWLSKLRRVYAGRYVSAGS